MWVRVSDRFGDNGLVGVGIATQSLNLDSWYIDTFLLSCRIIGRNLEYAFLDYIMNKLKNKKCKKIQSQYISTKKNQLVKNFYEKCNFKLISEDQLEKNYILELSKYKSRDIKYIKLLND